MANFCLPLQPWSGHSTLLDTQALWLKINHVSCDQSVDPNRTNCSTRNYQFSVFNLENSKYFFFFFFLFNYIRTNSQRGFWSQHCCLSHPLFFLGSASDRPKRGPLQWTGVNCNPDYTTPEQHVQVNGFVVLNFSFPRCNMAINIPLWSWLED